MIAGMIIERWLCYALMRYNQQGDKNGKSGGAIAGVWMYVCMCVFIGLSGGLSDDACPLPLRFMESSPENRGRRCVRWDDVLYEPHSPPSR